MVSDCILRFSQMSVRLRIAMKPAASRRRATSLFNRKIKERPKAPSGDKMAGFLRRSIAPEIVGFDRVEFFDVNGKQAVATTINRLIAREARLSCDPRSCAFASLAISLRAAAAGRKPTPVGEGAKAKDQILRQIDGRFAGVGALRHPCIRAKAMLRRR
jgi:hypothetical protein